MFVEAYDMCNLFFAAKDAGWETGKYFLERHNLTATREEYFTKHTGHDWFEYWIALGATPIQARTIIKEFGEKYLEFEPSALVPGAQEIFDAIKPITFVTNAQGGIPQMRVRHYGLEQHVSRIMQPPAHKGEALCAVSGGMPLLYCGDAVGDAQAVAYVREQGISALFIAMTHEYGVHPTQLQAYAEQNPEFCIVAKELADILPIRENLRHAFQTPHTATRS